MQRRWLRIAHRGASGTAPEHTLAAFRRALEIGVDMIELDVQLSKDGQLVVIHDSHLERTTNGSGAVQDHDWTDLKQLDAGSWFGREYEGQRVLRLDDVVDIVDGRVRLNVEIKATGDCCEVLSERVVGLLAQRELIQTTIVSSFDLEVLRTVRAQNEAVAIGVLTHQPDFDPILGIARDLRAVSVHPYWAFATPESIARSHDEGIDVIAWTVNEVDAMDALIVQGVDGIISDYPERFSLVGKANVG